jgi:hypothetical protein
MLNNALDSTIRSAINDCLNNPRAATYVIPVAALGVQLILSPQPLSTVGSAHKAANVNAALAALSTGLKEHYYAGVYIAKNTGQACVINFAPYFEEFMLLLDNSLYPYQATTFVFGK